MIFTDASELKASETVKYIIYIIIIYLQLYHIQHKESNTIYTWKQGIRRSPKFKNEHQYDVANTQDN